MDKVARNILIKLFENGQLSRSSVPKSAEGKIRQFREAGFIAWEKSGPGSILVVKKRDSIKKLLKATGYHGPTEHLTPKGQAVANHGDAHAGKDDTLIFHLSATDNVWWYNHGASVHLSKIVEECGIASILVRPEDNWRTENPIALVENLDLLVYAGRYFKNIPFKGNIMYYAGWASDRTIEWLKQQEKPPEIIFPDYDLVGLSNYLKLKDIFPEIKLYIPDNLEELIRRFGGANRLEGQVKQGYIIQSKDNDALFVFDLIEKYGQCLDQEALLLDLGVEKKK